MHIILILHNVYANNTVTCGSPLHTSHRHNINIIISMVISTMCFAFYAQHHLSLQNCFLRRPTDLIQNIRTFLHIHMHINRIIIIKWINSTNNSIISVQLFIFWCFLFLFLTLSGFTSCTTHGDRLTLYYYCYYIALLSAIILKQISIFSAISI